MIVTSKLRRVVDEAHAKGKVPEEEPNGAESGPDFQEVAKRIALVFEALMPDADPKDIHALLRALVIGKQKTLLLTTLRKSTMAKAKTQLRAVRKELT